MKKVRMLRRTLIYVRLLSLIGFFGMLIVGSAFLFSLIVGGVV